MNVALRPRFDFYHVFNNLDYVDESIRTLVNSPRRCFLPPSLPQQTCGLKLSRTRGTVAMLCEATHGFERQNTQLVKPHVYRKMHALKMYQDQHQKAIIDRHRDIRLVACNALHSLLSERGIHIDIEKSLSGFPYPVRHGHTEPSIVPYSV